MLRVQVSEKKKIEQVTASFPIHEYVRYDTRVSCDRKIAMGEGNNPLSVDPLLRRRSNQIMSRRMSDRLREGIIKAALRYKETFVSSDHRGESYPNGEKNESSSKVVGEGRGAEGISQRDSVFKNIRNPSSSQQPGVSRAVERG